jgi:hypothetical protein
MSLSLTSQPGFTELPDSTFDAGNPLTAASLKSLNADAKFGAVRNEQFWGYYRNGETVALPTSPVDGYEYSRAELLYTWSLYWTASAPSACNGTHTPATGATSGQGLVLQARANVDQSSGLVSTMVSYYKTSQQDTTDGILMVIIHAQRNR